MQVPNAQFNKPDANAGPNNYRAILIYALFGGYVLLLYLPILQCDFVNFDDDIYITDNEHVRTGLSVDNIIWAFTSSDVSYWHPVTWLSHMLDCQLFGLKASWHHLTSVLLHTVNALLLFALVRRMTGAMWKSAFVAALFALHPLNVDSVAWLAERKNILSTLFWLLTLHAYLGYARKGRIRRYVVTLLLYCLGLMAKPMLVTLPFVMLLLDYWPLARLSGARGSGRNETQPAPIRHLLLEKVPFFVLSAVAVYIFSLAAQRPGTAVPAGVVPMKLRLANAIVSYAGYIWKMVRPVNLAVYYPFPDKVDIGAVIAALILLSAISLAIALAAGRRPYLAVGWLWYLGTLVPVSGLYQAGLWPAMADRWAYVPLIGLFIIIAWLLGEIAGHQGRRIAGITLAATLALALLSALTHKQIGYWKNGQTLFAHALEVTERNLIAHYNLANILLKDGRTDEAITHYKKAVEINNNYIDAHYNLGIAYFSARRFDEAVKEYLAVLHLKKDYKDTYSRLADALARSGRLDEAINYYHKALESKPDDPEILNNLALAMVKKGKIEDAVQIYKKSLEGRPDSAEVLNNLGNALAKLQRLDEAIKCYNKALKIKPDLAEAHYNLAEALRQKGWTQQAIEHYHRSLQLRDDADSHYGLGLALAALGRYDQAAAQYRKAIELNKNFARAYYQLGLLLYKNNDLDGAIQQFRRVLRIFPDDAQMHRNLGTLLARKGLHKEAVAELKKALELDPSLTDARRQLNPMIRLNEPPDYFHIHPGNFSDHPWKSNIGACASSHPVWAGGCSGETTSWQRARTSSGSRPTCTPACSTWRSSPTSRPTWRSSSA